jgi:hypothetical protein
MIVDFNELPNWSKLWVFPSSRKFYPQEIPQLEERLKSFLNDWNSEGELLNCSFELRYNRFIIIAVDNSNISLSLKTYDDLTAFIQGIEKEFDVVLFDKINVCYKQGEFVQYKDIIEFKKMMKNKGVSSKTIVFDNMITSKEEYLNNWEINIMDSWLGRFLQKKHS